MFILCSESTVTAWDSDNKKIQMILMHFGKFQYLGKVEVIQPHLTSRVVTLCDTIITKLGRMYENDLAHSLHEENRKSVSNILFEYRQCCCVSKGLV
jgi:hypothetical protein